MWEDVTNPVVIPFWGLVILAMLSAVALLDRLLLPAVRLVWRRRANRAIDELNTRLKLRIQPFKTRRRQVLISRLMDDPELIAAVEAHAAETGIARDVALATAARYAREIVPSFSAGAYFRIGTRLARRVSQALYRVRLGYANDDALKAVPPDAAVVFVINHRSNMDYVLVTYVAASYSALSYAVGEWAQVWGLRGLIRSMGAYFIRRNSGDPLYRKVLSRYVDMATKAGVVQAIFPEGGLSQDGALRPPKFGLLSYMVAGFDPQGPRDVVFIPVGLNYDRVLEDRVLTSAAKNAQSGAPRFRFDPFVFTGFIFKNLWLLIRGNWHRYGYACVSFGQPVSLKNHLVTRNIDLRILSAAARHAEIEILGAHLMAAVGRVIPALPVSLVATVLVAAHDEQKAGTPIEAQPQSLTLFELKGRVAALISHLEQTGAHVHIPRRDRDYAIEVGLRMLRKRYLLLTEQDSYRANPGEIHLLRYYAQAIAHLFPAQPLPTTAPPEQRARTLDIAHT
jgi:glycerol-3-phosphate O-acyltransferase